MTIMNLDDFGLKLAGIYDLPHCPASFLQSSQSCKYFMKLFLEMFDPLWVSMFPHTARHETMSLTILQFTERRAA